MYAVNLWFYRSRNVQQLGVKSVVSTHKVKEFSIENEPVLPYTKGTKERKDLEAALADYSNNCVEVPIVIGGKEYKTDRVMYQPMVSDITGRQTMKSVIFNCYYKQILLSFL